LTTTAERYFERLGFKAIGRDAAPPEVRETREYSSLCPSFSSLMMKSL